MNKTAHFMISKYPGTCNKCGDKVNAGESIYWLSRGKIECNACTGGAASAETLKPATATAPAQTDDRHADKWAAAMDWDNSAPAAGASIAATASAEKPATPRKAKSAPKPKPAKAVPVVVSAVPTDAERKIIDARMIAAGHTPPAPAPETAPETTVEPERDAVAAMVCDQLALLVNALDNATGAQRQAVRTYAEKFATDTIVPSRARIWHALATAAIS